MSGDCTSMHLAPPSVNLLTDRSIQIFYIGTTFAKLQEVESLAKGSMIALKLTRNPQISHAVGNDRCVLTYRSRLWLVID